MSCLQNIQTYFSKRKFVTLVTNNNLHIYARVVRKNGGGRGIRTPAGFDSPVGFQDRSLQPNLGIPPCQQNIIYHVRKLKSTTKQSNFIILLLPFFTQKPHWYMMEREFRN